MGMLEQIAKDLEELKEKLDKLPALGLGPSPEMESKFKDKEGLKAEEAAEYLGVGRSSILRHKEQLPHAYLGSRLIFPKSVLREWLEEKSMENVETDVIEKEDYILRKLS
ncbi:helix-turn-helix domain-containing protein [Halanaerobium salsuginis]|uniref:DNA binding domain-containing protein, excisionase family n=1 Tax=Halanaerobium salsuginis TaxID=29563 RepID=A0A1I4EZT3_9FIRM|nr:helix-turn-helix domain-containing protein [Halanaerobium salsuginis]SFL09641.1 DNA binding domain-containing protein, excisionase family [Halanaerobium salsuginis]